MAPIPTKRNMQRLFALVTKRQSQLVKLKHNSVLLERKSTVYDRRAQGVCKCRMNPKNLCHLGFDGRETVVKPANHGELQMPSTSIPQSASPRHQSILGNPLTHDTDVLISSETLGAPTVRKAQHLLTGGKILMALGFAFAAVPMLFALPGLILLIAGRESFLHGEWMWNAAHRLPQRFPTDHRGPLL